MSIFDSVLRLYQVKGNKMDSRNDYRADRKSRWLAMERYRLQCAEAWPDSPHKRATVAAIRSTMESLMNKFLA